MSTNSNTVERVMVDAQNMTEEDNQRRIKRLRELREVLDRRFQIYKTIDEINDFVGEAW